MQFYEYDATGNRIKHSDSSGVFASVTYDSENRPVASTDRAGRVTRTEYWPTGQVKRRISPDGNFIGYEYDIEGRLTKVWESVPEQNSAQAAGPFGGSKDVALTKTIEYYYGVKNDGTNGQNLSWTGTQLNAGTYIAGVRTYTYKGAGPVYYDMVYTSNAHGQPEKTLFIDDDDSTTRTTTRLYTWRGKNRRVVNPDTNYLDYTYDDHLRMTAEKLNGDTEKYTYEYCLCGAIKRHKYTYTDSLSHSQTETWTETTDDLGRKVKEYYPYPIAVDGSDEYHSLIYEFDTASRRKLYSDPTFGHTCADTSGWTDDTEPFDEENWLSNEPQRYLYGKAGGLEATGRTASSEIMASQGEPYFVQRDGAGRIAKVVYPDDDTTEVPQIEWQYSYGGDGRVKQVAAVKTTNADDTTYGPQKYVVQFFHDDVGRLVRKVVRDNMKQDTISTRYETKYEYDGRGQLTREQIIRYVASDDKMQVMSDIQTTYDLGRNPVTVKVYDNSGWAYTETRTYAMGYQLTGFSTSAAADVTISTHGSYTYDTNNNLATAKKLDATRGGNQLAYRAEWTFTYDRKNRLKSHTNTNASYVRGNIWYDGRGRIWQRWNDNSNTEDWDASLIRFVYDGSQLAQEHTFDVAEVLNAWVYTYDDLTRDYLRQPGGTRQRERSGGNDTDYFMQSNQGTLEYKIERSPVSETYARTERKTSLDQLPDSTFSNISNLATPNGYIEMYGGSTSGSSAGFDGLVQMGGRHYLAGVGRYIGGGSPNNPSSPGVPASPPNVGIPSLGGGLPSGKTFVNGGNGVSTIPEKLTDLNSECGPECLKWAAGQVEHCFPLWWAATGNLLYDFCCVPWICLWYFHDLTEDEVNNCMNCLCLAGRPDDEESGRGCLCKKLDSLSQEELGWTEYVKRALIKRDECKHRKPDCDYATCGNPNFCVNWVPLVTLDTSCGFECRIIVPEGIPFFETCVTPNICCWRHHFDEWVDKPDCKIISDLFPNLPSWLSIWAPTCCQCLVREIVRRAITFCDTMVQPC
jgi:YD repeat-containing protein